MQDKVIAIFGVPRTGTSWLGQIFDSISNSVYKYQPLFSYAFKDRISSRSTNDEIQDFFDELICYDNVFLNQTDMREKGYYPKFEKDYSSGKILVFKEVRYLYIIPHLLKVVPNIKVVMISRDVFGMMESWINAPAEYKKDWNIYEEWYFAPSKNDFLPENYYGYSKWKESQVLFKKMEREYGDKAIRIRYEDLCSDTLVQVKRLFDFCGLELEKQTINFLRESQSKTVDNAYGVYRKKGETLNKVKVPEEIKDWIKKDLEQMKTYNIL